MSDPQAYQFSIEGVADDADAWAAVEKRANQATNKLGSGARKMQAHFARVTGPARMLSPELDRAYQRMAKMGKLAGSMREAFIGARAASGRETLRAVAGERTSNGSSPNSGPSSGASGSIVDTARRFAAAEAGEGAAGAAGEVAGLGEAAAGAAEGVGSLAAAGAAAATGIAAIPLILAGGAIAAAKFVSPFARAGQEISRTADLIGVNADTLQRYRGAAELQGISPHSADSALGNIGKALHDARYGMGDASKVRLLQMAGVDLQKDDAETALQKVTVKLNTSGYDAFSKKHYADMLGVGDFLPAMNKGQGALNADLAAVDQTHVVQDADQRTRGVQASRSLTLFDQAKRGAGQAAALSAPVSGFAIAGADTARAGLEAAASGGGAAMKAVEGALQNPVAAFKAVTAGAGAALHSVEPAARSAAGALAGAARVIAGSIQELVAKIARAHGLDEKAALAIVQRESNFNPNAKAKTSSASGLYQFTKRTAKMVGLPWDQRFDPQQNAEAGARLERMNVDHMQGRLHRPVTAAEAYLAHFYGAGAAVRFEQARDRDPGGDAAAQFPKEAAANKGVFYEHGRHRTVDEVFHRLTDDRGDYSLAGMADAMPNGKVEVAVTVDDKRSNATTKVTGKGVVVAQQRAMTPT